MPRRKLETPADPPAAESPPPADPTEGEPEPAAAPPRAARRRKAAVPPPEPPPEVGEEARPEPPPRRKSRPRPRHMMPAAPRGTESPFELDFGIGELDFGSEAGSANRANLVELPVIPLRDMVIFP